ncbi:MAG: hypothetical protein NTW96_23850 [Planctomycetia bacterium]|nr:hypothetical protein [Planctomycetia bacterium]
MRRFTLVLAAVAALSLMATSTAHAATLSHGAATALAVGAVGHHPGPYYESHRAGWHRGPGMHRPPVVVVPYPPRPVIVVPQPVYPPPPPVYYAAPRAGFTYQGHGWGLSIGF